jgi:peptidyl-prolyl cis-trans isomerase SurA
MILMNNRIIIFSLALILSVAMKPAIAQEKVIDEVVAVVGGHPVLWSDVENQYQQVRMQGVAGDPAIMRCRIFEDMLLQKLLLYQSENDSLVVGDDQVNTELDRRLRYYIQQFGSQEKLKKF